MGCPEIEVPTYEWSGGSDRSRTLFCPYHEVRYTDMPVHVLRGQLTDIGQCVLPFELLPSGLYGRAVIDTGCGGLMLDQRLADRAGVAPTDMGATVKRIGSDDVFSLLSARLTIKLGDVQGGHFTYKGQFEIGVVPSGADLLLGTDFLVGGFFTLDGATETWEWRMNTDAPRIRRVR